MKYFYFNFNIGVQYIGDYIEVLNSDDMDYFGSNQTMKNQILHSVNSKWNNQNYHINIKVPPMGATFIKLKTKEEIKQIVLEEETSLNKF